MHQTRLKIIAGDPAEFRHAVVVARHNNGYPMPLSPSASRKPVPINMRDVKYRAMPVMTACGTWKPS
ncbi:hypothetical protein CtCNB1_1642 [Comamonas thiooxydans]|nr:hypothetical protein CtCNB1_1642 [Comamonas thiooxydans]